MKQLFTKGTWIGLLGAVLLVTTACGGGGGGGDDGGDDGGDGRYTGSTEPASVTDANAEALGADATEAATKAIEADSADGGGLPFGVSITGTTSLSQQVQDINQQIIESLRSSNLPLGYTTTSEDFKDFAGYCGGSVTIPDSWFDAGLGSSLNGTLTYNNFCLDVGAVYGRLTINGSITLSGGMPTSYNNLTMSFENGTVLTCNGSASLSCTSSTVYTGSSGSTYMVSDVSVSGSPSGYTINATYCNASYGCLTIATTDPIVFNCENGKPGSGTITFTSDNGSNGSITFDNCTSYTISYSIAGSDVVTTIGGEW